MLMIMPLIINHLLILKFSKTKRFFSIKIWQHFTSGFNNKSSASMNKISHQIMTSCNICNKSWIKHNTNKLLLINNFKIWLKTCFNIALSCLKWKKYWERLCIISIILQLRIFYSNRWMYLHLVRTTPFLWQSKHLTFKILTHKIWSSIPNNKWTMLKITKLLIKIIQVFRIIILNNNLHKVNNNLFLIIAINNNMTNTNKPLQVNRVMLIWDIALIQASKVMLIWSIVKVQILFRINRSNIL